MKIFIAGSRKLSKLSAEVRQRLDNIVEKQISVLVGDANGADKAVQQHLADRRYSNVTVFCMDGHCRNNVGRWPTKEIVAEQPSKRDFAYFSTKDRAMSAEATHGLMLWDGESRGTYTNIHDLIQQGKPVVVYFSPNKTFHNLRTEQDLTKLVELVEPAIVRHLRQQLEARRPPSAAPRSLFNQPNTTPGESQAVTASTLMQSRRYEESAQACVRNAEELLRVSERVLVAERIPRISFHLSTLALEEIGKARLFRLAKVAESAGEMAPAFVIRSLDNHVRKLFHAVWGPTIGQEKVTRAQIEENLGFARHVHDTRVRGLYVDLSTDQELHVPNEVIPEEQARALLDLTRARLELDRRDDSDEVTPEVRELQAWWFSTTEDPERQKAIFGSKSMEKLVELGHPAPWMRWLKAEFDKADAEARELVERELARVPPKPSDQNVLVNKWKLKLRLYSRSHSIRQNQLNEFWNDGVKWIKLNAVSGGHDHKRQLDVELLIPGIPVGAIWESGFTMARRIVSALNISSMGFFWWTPAQQIARYYETLTDLETNREMRLERSPALNVDWKQDALVGGHLRNMTLVMAMLHAFQKPEEREPIETHYYAGLTFLGKTDVHMTFEPHACTAFYHALRSGLCAYENATVDEVPSRLKVWISEMFPTLDVQERDKMIAIGEGLVLHRLPDQPLTLSDVALLKIFCDAYFVSIFRRMEPAKLRRRESKKEQDSETLAT